MDALGLASDDYSFPYVAQWSDGNVESIRQAGDRVVACARNIPRCLEAEKGTCSVTTTQGSIKV